MNQNRLFEMARDAGLPVTWWAKARETGEEVPEWRELKKFAELVVLECERIAKDPQWYSDRPSDGWRNPINHVCKVMKEEFGVKE